MSREKFLNYGLSAFFFLLPWQTRWIFAQAEIVGEPFSMGSMSLYGTELILVVLFIFLVFHPEPAKDLSTQVSQNREIKKALVALGVVATISILFAVNTDLAWTQLMHLGFAGLVFILLADKRVDLLLIAKAFIAGLILPSLLGIWQVLAGSSPDSTLLGLAARDAQTLGDAVISLQGDRFLRAYGSFPHPNIFAGFLAVGLLSIVFVWQSLTDLKDKVFISVSALILATAFAASFSRSAWLGFVFGLFAAMAILLVYGKPLVRHSKLIAVSSAIIVTVVILGLVSGRFDPSTKLESASVTERVEQYQEFPSVMNDSDWFFGNGIGNYALTLSEVDVSKEWWQYQPIHNVPLLIIGEIGLIGFILLVIFAAKIDILNFRRFPNTDALIAFAMGNTVLVIAMLDHYLWSTWAGLTLSAYVLAFTLRLGEDYAP